MVDAARNENLFSCRTYHLAPEVFGVTASADRHSLLSKLPGSLSSALYRSWSAPLPHTAADKQAKLVLYTAIGPYNRFW